jgi:hypothetical protein
MWFLTACGDDVIASGSSTTVADQIGGLPMGGPEIPGAPEPVASREPLPYCGAEVIGFTDRNPYEFIELVPGASECYRNRATAGQPTELITVGYTIEGDPVLTIHRLMPDGREIFFADATQDKFGAMAWVMIECDQYQEPGSGDDRCADRVELEGAGS